MGNIAEATTQGIIESMEKVEEGVEKVLDKTEIVVKDTVRTAGTVVDNIRGDVLFTFRDSKHEVLTMLDSTLDNFTLVFDRQANNLFNTIQMSALLGTGMIVLVLILYGDKLFQNGIRLGRLNLL
jgi:ABC-type sulfate transport system substrate-binding protein